jgi:hypothetical protein|tara:strand:+ start:2329 stop:3231 length:903 start_codon:yes stop_codon:yes gene_type:complete
MVDVVSQEVITAATFNGLQSRIETVLGQGFTDTGYGQSLSSSIVAANTVITAQHLNNLKSDIDKCRAHQTGSLSPLETIGVTDQIGATESISASGAISTSKGINDYLALLNNIEGDKQQCDDTQASVEAVLSSTRVSEWNGTIIHKFLITFASIDARRHFFNAGGQLRIQGQLTSGSSAKDSDWATMLSAMGTITIASHATTQSGTGVPTAVGNFELTSTSQRLFHKLGTAYDYSNNMFQVNAKTIDSDKIEIEIQLQDNADGGGDPNVTGTITSSITHRRPSGTYVSIPSPTYSNTTLL